MKSNPSDDPLESQLRADARRLVTPPPAGMDWRISQAVARSRRPARQARPLLAWISALGAAAGIAAVLLLALRPAAPVSNPAEDRATAASLAEAMKTMPTQIWNTVQPKAQAALQNEPLQKEATDLYSDARSAVGFLAYNFLPQSAAQPATPPAS